MADADSAACRVKGKDGDRMQQSIVALPSRRVERATVIAEASLESVEERGEEGATAEDSDDDDDDEEEGLVAYGDHFVYPTVLFKTNPFLVDEETGTKARTQLRIDTGLGKKFSYVS